MIEPRFLAHPYTRAAGGEYGELTIPADNGAPLVEADCNVLFAETKERGPSRISILGRVSGTAEAAAVVTLKWYLFHSVSQEFYQAAHMLVVGSTGFTPTMGNIWVVNHNPQCQKGYFEALNLVANQDLHIIVDVVAV